MFLRLTYANSAKGSAFLINAECIGRVKPARDGKGTTIWLRDGDSRDTLSIDVREDFETIAHMLLEPGR
jgi:predicted phage gp36 major capsid-like protein